MMRLLPFPPGQWPTVHTGGARERLSPLKLSIPRDLLVAPGIAALGFRHRPPPRGPIHGASYLRHTVGMGQASEASQVISPLVPSTLKQKEEAGKLLPSVFENNPSCSLLAEWGLSDLPGGGDIAGLS